MERTQTQRSYLSYQRIKYSCFRNEILAELICSKQNRSLKASEVPVHSRRHQAHSSATKPQRDNQVQPGILRGWSISHNMVKAPIFLFKHGETSTVLLKTKKKAQL